MTESTMELLVERAFDAPPERVYRAFTEEDQLAAWGAPAAFSVPRDSVDIDASVGGHQRFTLISDDGSTSSVDVTYTAVVENELLAGEERVAAVPGGHGEFVRTFRVEFQDAGEQTRLVLRQGPFSREAGGDGRGAYCCRMESGAAVRPGSVEIAPITAVPWADVERVFGIRGDPSRCWCQYFKMPNARWWEAPADEKAGLLRAQTKAGDPAPGLIAYLDGEPVGWCAVEPRIRYPRILRSKLAADSIEPADDDSVWAVSCFVVRVGFRRHGISGALMTAAVDWARANGARVLEGYPVDPTAREKSSAAELYHGTLSLFEAAGFEVVSQPTPSRALVRLDLR